MVWKLERVSFEFGGVSIQLEVDEAGGVAQNMAVPGHSKPEKSGSSAVVPHIEVLKAIVLAVRSWALWTGTLMRPVKKRTGYSLVDLATK